MTSLARLDTDPRGRIEIEPERSEAQRNGGGRCPAPSRPPSKLSWLTTRCRDSVWLPVALKASGIGGAMLLLAGVGAASMATPSQGAPITSTAPLVGTSPVADRAAASAERTAPSNGVEQEPAHAEEPEAPKREEADRRTGSGITSDGRVILNIANAEELTRLPGVGKKRAEAIVELRTRLKRFRRPTDLLRVKGIGKKTLAKMLPHLVVDAEDPSAAPK